MKKIFIFICSFFIFIGITKADNLDSYVVIDMESGRVLKELSKDKIIYPASTTKVMTALVAIENMDPMKVVKVGDEILTIDGTNIYAEIGENILMEDLLYGMMLRSGNDAAMIIAKNVGGKVDNFVNMMNQRAKILGLRNTYFENPTGLDDTTKNSSSVYDLALIYKEAYKNNLFKDIVSTKSYKTESDKKSYYFKNKNDLLKLYPKATGGKTGYTPKAGRLLVSSAFNGDLNIVISSHGDGYGYKDHINMYEDIFSKYKNYVILDKYRFNEKTDLNGTLYINNSFSYPLKEDELSKVKKEVIYNKNKKGEVGEIYIYLNNDLIHRERIYLKENKASLFDKIKKFFS